MRTSAVLLAFAAGLAACGAGCSWDVGLGGRPVFSDYDYPRADARPVEHGIVGYVFRLPGREAPFGVELGLFGAMGDGESDYWTASAGARWFRPDRDSVTGERTLGPFVGIGLAYVDMRLATWDGSMSGRDQDLAGYVSFGLAQVGKEWPVGIEFRYTFATDFELLGGRMEADGLAFLVYVGI